MGSEAPFSPVNGASVAEAAHGRAHRFLKGRRLLVSVILAWSITVVSTSWLAFLGANYIGLMILVLSPVLWLLPLGLLPKAPGRAAHAAPFLLFAVPVVLASSAYVMTEDLSLALLYRDRADSERHSSGSENYVRDQLSEYRTKMAEFNEGLRISAGGGALAALLEVLGLYCWTRRMPAQRWSIALLLAVFGPAVVGAIYFFEGVGFPLTA